MLNRSIKLEEAARDIDPESLDEAKAAVIASCQEYIRWADLFSRRLDDLPYEELHKFARAFSLTMLGHLPTRPGTCPFCIQYGQDRSCSGCGYSATHGRCDADDSAFSLFIESFMELGKLIFQDITSAEGPDGKGDEKKRQLSHLLESSSRIAGQMQKSLNDLSAIQFMQKKQAYISQMIQFIPISFLSNDVKEQLHVLQDRLKDYW